MIRLGTMLAAALVMSAVGATANAKMATQTFPVLAGAGPHDVYPAPDGAVWFTAQSAGRRRRGDGADSWSVARLGAVSRARLGINRWLVA
jgi:virginiamycin B lyase